MNFILTRKKFLTENMKIAYGSIAGSVHKKLEYNNQDFVLVTQNDKMTIGLIADGCGSGSNSEVGAQLSLNFILKWLNENIDRDDWKARIKTELQNYSIELAERHSTEPEHFIMNYLLYTVVGVIVKENIATVFSCGDGAIIKDDELIIIDQNNKPKYINNELIGNEGGDFEFYEFDLNDQLLVLGSDGLVDLIEGMAKGFIDEYQTLEEFIKDDRHFSNPVFLPKLLQKYSNTGILKDDCSTIMLKNI